MKVYLASFMHSVDESPAIRGFRNTALQDRFGVHSLAKTPESADLVLFVDAHLCHDFRMRRLFSSELYRGSPHNAFIYDESDQPWLSIPGVYISMPKSTFNHKFQYPWMYYKAPVSCALDMQDPVYLFSFIGTPGHVTSKGHRVRMKILSIGFEGCFIKDSSGFVFYDDQGDPDKYMLNRKLFEESIMQSKFVICPRGAGSGSIRLYETMRMGRVPVILSDEWVEPEGPDWDRFAIRLPEKDVHKLPELLIENEDNWAEMGYIAKEEFEKWFAPDVTYHHMIEGCKKIKNTVDEEGYKVNYANRRYIELYLLRLRKDIRGLARAILVSLRLMR